MKSVSIALPHILDLQKNNVMKWDQVLCIRIFRSVTKEGIREFTSNNLYAKIINIQN